MLLIRQYLQENKQSSVDSRDIDKRINHHIYWGGKQNHKKSSEKKEISILLSE
jgi:hypothetical protein